MCYFSDDSPVQVDDVIKRSRSNSLASRGGESTCGSISLLEEEGGEGASMMDALLNEQIDAVLKLEDEAVHAQCKKVCSLAFTLPGKNIRLFYKKRPILSKLSLIIVSLDETPLLKNALSEQRSLLNKRLFNLTHCILLPPSKEKLFSHFSKKIPPNTIIPVSGGLNLNCK